MSPFLVATIRRHWPVLGALGLLLVVTAVNQFWYGPAAVRYHRTLKQANELGMALDPEVTPAFMPPRLFALLTDNSLSVEDAEAMARSGTLTAQLLQDVTSLTSARGIQVIVTEPGPISQQAMSVQVRAHVRLRCRYDQYVALLEDMTKSGKLFAVDRFTFSADGFLDLWVSRLILRRDRARR